MRLTRTIPAVFLRDLAYWICTQRHTKGGHIPDDLLGANGQLTILRTTGARLRRKIGAAKSMLLCPTAYARKVRNTARAPSVILRKVIERQRHTRNSDQEEDICDPGGPTGTKTARRHERQ